MTLHPNGMSTLYLPRDGAVHQATSFDRDPDRGGTWGGLRPAPARRKRILLQPGESHTAASIVGAGVINRIWMTTLPFSNPHALRDLVLRCYWDGEDRPSVESPLGDFFGAPFGRSVPYSAAPMSLTGGGFSCLFPMPFASGARLEIANDGPSTVDPLFYAVTYTALDRVPAGSLRFHAQWRREDRTQRGVPYTVLDARGQGHYVGCHLFMQNRTWWLRPPLKAAIFPYGIGLGMLEGQERLWIDDEPAPAVVGTGTEDYFNAGWYFVGGPFSAPYHGCPLRSTVTGRVAAYRFDVTAPTPFRKSLRLTFDHGYENQVDADYASVAYWYQAEPHQPFAPLPSALERRPLATWSNMWQFVLSLGAPGVVAWALRWMMRAR